MSVYVDPLFQWGDRGHYCHMTADTLDELHAFARRLGLPRRWMHISSSGIPHYGLTRLKRWHAVNQGAIELSAAEWLVKAKQHRVPVKPDEA